jgi:hypothetical protein
MLLKSLCDYLPNPTDGKSIWPTLIDKSISKNILDLFESNNNIEKVKQAKEALHKIADQRKTKQITEYIKNIIYRATNILNIEEIEKVFELYEEVENEKLLEFLLIFSKYFPELFQESHKKIMDGLDDDKTNKTLMLNILINIGNKEIKNEIKKKYKTKLLQLIKSDHEIAKYSVKAYSKLFDDFKEHFEDYIDDIKNKLNYDENILINLAVLNQVCKISFEAFDLNSIEKILSFIFEKVLVKPIVFKTLKIRMKNQPLGIKYQQI